MRALVLGASGMAGHVVSIYLDEHGFDVVPLSGHKSIVDKTIVLDLTDTQKFEAFLKDHEFDVIVNCAGILIEQSEKRKDLATSINSFLPHYLEHRFENGPTKIIHLSTDCVFSGKNAPYKEDSPFDGELFYDRSKALGEIINNKDLTFRMSIIGPDASPEGIGLFNWFEKQSGTIFGFKNSMWNGITTIELAKGIVAAIENNLTGLYHLVPETNISKYDLLKLFKNVFERNDITVQLKENEPTDKTLLNTRKDFAFTPPDYPSMITEMKVWIDSHTELYPHYKKS